MFLSSCFIWGMEEFYQVFFFSVTFMSLEESHIGDQLSEELKLMHDLKFMRSFSVLLNTYCPILHNTVYEFQVSWPKWNHIETCAEASFFFFFLLCSLKFFLLLDCALKLISEYFEQSLGHLILKI